MKKTQKQQIVKHIGKKAFSRYAGGLLALLLGLFTVACGAEKEPVPQPAPTEESGNEGQQPPVSESADAADNTDAAEADTDYGELFKSISLSKSFKGIQNSNPIIEQHYGADPYALVYDDTVYLYMTADAYEYDSGGEIKDNTYSQIRSLYVVSTKDMINFTDHGEIKIAGPDGAAGKWAMNSWAPAAAWKMVEGKPKFFLYFADNGGGIGVVTSDSPTGPFTDELGQGLIRRDMENCGNVEWLFDPAVLMDDDGKAYIYFGGGVPEGKAAHPMTARCAQLGDDMMSLAGPVQTIDAPYLFEDSGIHKYGDTYYYSYCTNFSVDEAGTAEYGFGNAEICVMTSSDPMGPFTYSERILRNPQYAFGIGGNNHHAVFEFKDRWYICYHTRLLEKEQGILNGYRSTSIDEFRYKEDGSIGEIAMSRNGREQRGYLDPYEPVNGATFAVMGGVDTAPADTQSEKYGCGNLLLTSISDGDFVKLQGVDFGEKGPAKVAAKVRTNGKEGVIRVTAGYPNKDVLAYIPVKGEGSVSCEALIDIPVTGVKDVFFTFSGEGYEVEEWVFTER